MSALSRYERDVPATNLLEPRMIWRLTAGISDNRTIAVSRRKSTEHDVLGIAGFSVSGDLAFALESHLSEPLPERAGSFGLGDYHYFGWSSDNAFGCHKINITTAFPPTPRTFENVEVANEGW